MKANCQNCSKEFEYGPHQRRGKYCNNTCQGEHKSRLHKESWYRGELKRIERATMRRYLTEDRGYQCEVCGISNWQNKKLTLQVDHIDGNPGDDSPSNIRLICPNCHSQTPFLGNGNKGRGRGSQGLPLN
jgi:5-methylcytosine-specific restriction endonuclease McrA